MVILAHQTPPEVRDMWYSVSYSCEGHVHDDLAVIEEIALAAIINFKGMLGAYCSSSANDDYRKGHRFATHYLGTDYNNGHFIFRVLDPDNGYQPVAMVAINFRWNISVGEDKFATATGFTAHATLSRK